MKSLPVELHETQNHGEGGLGKRVICPESLQITELQPQKEAQVHTAQNPGESPFQEEGRPHQINREETAYRPP